MRKLASTTFLAIVAGTMLVSLQPSLGSQENSDESVTSPHVEVRRIPEDGTQQHGTLLEEYTVLIEDGEEFKHGRYRRWLENPYVLVAERWYYKGKAHGPQFLAQNSFGVVKNREGDAISDPQYRREFFCVDGRLHGTDRSYYANGQVSAEKEYRFGEHLWSKAWWPSGGQQFSWDNVGDGYRRTWYESGQIKSESQLKEGRYVGRSRDWYSSGQLWIEQYHNEEGLRHGPYVSWHENGQKAEEGSYHRIEKIGEWKYWDDEGKLIRTEDHGEPDPERK